MKALSLMHWDRCSCYCLLGVPTHTIAAQNRDKCVCVYKTELKRKNKECVIFFFLFPREMKLVQCGFKTVF